MAQANPTSTPSIPANRLQSQPSSLSIALLKVALVHYHLRTGGVTKVVANQSAALTQQGIEHLILSAGPEPEGLPHVLVPELDYLAEASPDSNRLSQILRDHFVARHGSGPDLWHIHNPTLGKNILFPQLIQDIAESETPLILQPHDFAEDNRPSNYPLLAGEHIYPLAPQIHYAFLNSRDQSRLQEAGLPPAQTHLLPNAVVAPGEPTPPAPSEQTTVLYPVRGIRRKNIGEILLLATLSPPDTRFALPLAPENPKWQPIYQRWQDFAREHKLPVLFNVAGEISPVEGAPNNYQSWLSHSTHLITTSIAEGFGLAFLEPILHQKPLIGRDLPEITDDFRRNEISPGRLYHSIPIPLQKLDQTALRTQLRKHLLKTYTQYNTPFQESHFEAAWEHLTADDIIDFGNLPESFQEQIISEVLTGQANYLHPIRMWLQFVLSQDQTTSTPEQLKPYTLSASQKSLTALYQTALAAPASPPSWLPKSQVLAQYLSPEGFHFLRS